MAASAVGGTIGARHDTAPTPWAWLTALTVLALVLRTIGLNGGLWYDEIVTLDQSVRNPLWQIVTTFPSNNQHTLFSVLAHWSIGVFGEHAWSLRLPAMLLGVATVPALYFFAREVAGQTEALLASFLLTVAYHHVWFSQNARAYSTMALLTVVSSWLLLRGLRRGRTSDFVWYGVVAALSVYAHLTMGFLVLSHALLCLMPPRLFGFEDGRRSRWQPFIGFAVAGALTVVLYVPLLAGMEQFFIEHGGHPEVATPAWAVLALIEGLRAGMAGWTAALIGGSLVLLGLRSYFKESPFVVGLFVLPGVLTVAGTIALSRPLLPRFLFPLAGFAAMVIIRGAIEAGRLIGGGRSEAVPLRTPALSLALVAIMTAASLAALSANYRYPKQDFDGALRFVEAQHASDPIATVGATSVVYRDHYGRDFPDIETPADLQRIRAQGRRVWVLYTLDESIEAEMPAVMDLLRSDCGVVGYFRGTVGHGDITVCTTPPRGMAQNREAPGRVP